MTQKITRRTALGLLGAGLSALAYDTNAFSTLSASRSINLNTAPNESAALSIVGEDPDGIPVSLSKTKFRTPLTVKLTNNTGADILADDLTLRLGANSTDDAEEIQLQSASDFQYSGVDATGLHLGDATNDEIAVKNDSSISPGETVSLAFDNIIDRESIVTVDITATNTNSKTIDTALDGGLTLSPDPTLLSYFDDLDHDTLTNNNELNSTFSLSTDVSWDWDDDSMWDDSGDNTTVTDLRSNWQPPGTDNAPFTGTIYGENQQISNFMGTSDSTERGEITAGDGDAGLVANLGSSGFLENVRVSIMSVIGGRYAGGLVGNNRGTIQNCTVTSSTNGRVQSTGSVATGAAGGLVGRNDGGTVQYCEVLGINEVESSTAPVGGLVGENRNSATVAEARTEGFDIRVDTDGKDGPYYAGGLIGTNENSTVDNVYSQTSIFANNSQNSGAIRGGGLVGYNDGGTVELGYATTNLKEIDGITGGVVAVNAGGSTVRNAFFAETPAGETRGVGADSGTRSFVAGFETSSDMQGASAIGNMSALDFDEVWSPQEGGKYPELRELQPIAFDTDIDQDGTGDSTLTDQSALSGPFDILVTNIDNESYGISIHFETVETGEITATNEDGSSVTADTSTTPTVAVTDASNHTLSPGATGAVTLSSSGGAKGVFTVQDDSGTIHYQFGVIIGGYKISNVSLS